MSLSVDGTWKAGVWATTVWADGVWREGAQASLPDSPLYYELVTPDFVPGPAPRGLGKFDAAVDRDFQVLAKLATLSSHLEDVQEWLAEQTDSDIEPIDVFEAEGLEPDDELFGRSKKWRRNR